MSHESDQAGNLEQEICLCFHVSRRKIEQFIRLEKPKRVGQLAECFAAGTGCGWCRPWLTAIFESGAKLQAMQPESADVIDQSELEIPSAEQYAELRRQYRNRQGDSSE